MNAPANRGAVFHLLPVRSAGPAVHFVGRDGQVNGIPALCGARGIPDAMGREKWRRVQGAGASVKICNTCGALASGASVRVDWS